MSASTTVGQLARAEVATTHTADVSVENVHVTAGDVAVDGLRVEETVEEERQVVLEAAEITENGSITFVRYEHTERVFRRRIIDIMYIAALNEPEDPEELEPTNKEKCVDCCCQSFRCNFSSITNREFGESFQTIDYLTPVLRRGRAKGWVMHAKLIPNLVRNTFRNVWIALEAVFILVLLALSIASVSTGKNEVFNIVHLVLAILGNILAITDLTILFAGCKFQTHAQEHTHHHEPEGGRNPISNHDEPANRRMDPESEAVNSNEKCKTCLTTRRSMFDFIRIFLSELIFYPLLICNIFEVTTSQSYLFSNATDGISFFLFVISSLSFIFLVYAVRIFILIVINHYSQKVRTPEKGDKIVYPDYDPTISRAAKYFQSYFIYHVIAQMVVQILMIMAIGAKIQDDNHHLFEDTIAMNTNTNETSIMSGSGIIDGLDINATTEIMDMDEGIRVTNALWYMMVAGYVLPYFGLLTFFVVTYFWVQEFPIGFCIDCLSILKYTEKNKEESNKIDKIKVFVQFAELKRQFEHLQNTSWCSKFSYPFRTPQMVILCIMYMILQFTFTICADTSSGEDGPLGGRNWNYFYLVAILVANFYAFAVALFWSVIIISVIALIAALIAFIIIIITCYIICICFIKNAD